MKKLFMLFTALWLSLVSSHALANDVWVKKPNFSNLEFDKIQLCYDIKMAYFNDCEVFIHMEAVLHINKRGKITHVEGVNTGDEVLDWRIVRALKKARMKPVIKDGVALEGTAIMPIRLRIKERPHKIKVDNSNVANLLRIICANDDKCDQDELEMALKQKRW